MILWIYQPQGRVDKVPEYAQLGLGLGLGKVSLSSLLMYPLVHDETAAK